MNNSILRLHNSQRWVHGVFITLIVISFLFIINRVRWHFSTTFNPYLFAIAFFYILSHCLRVGRLVLLTLEQQISIRKLFYVHFYSAAASRLLPFKIGEVYRIANISQLLPTAVDAIMIVWIERLLDVLVIGGGLLIILLRTPELMMSYLLLISLMIGFILFSTILLVVIPENAIEIKKMLIMKANQVWVVKSLHYLSRLEHFVGRGSRLIAKKFITLLLLSVAIWFCELIAISVFLFSEQSSVNAVKNLLATLVENFTSDNIFTISTITTSMYAFATLSSLLFLGVLSLFFYMRSHFNTRKVVR